MLTFLFAAALAFPVPASPPIPVTTPVLNRPPGLQSDLHVASNGSIDFAVWNDARSGHDVIGTRVNSDGMPLDPAGIVVHAGAWVKDVFWTGSAFAVVTLPNPPPQLGIAAVASATSYGYTVVYVGSDGSVTQPKPLVPADSMSYATHSGEGPNAHLLFLPSDGFARFARVVDLQGRVIRQGTSDRPYAYAKALAASNGSTFLVLRQNQGSLIAETLDFDGGWGGSSDAHLPMFYPLALSYDGHGGYVLSGYDSIRNAYAVARLDAAGVSVGPPQVAESYAADAAYEPVNDLLFTVHDDKNTLTSADLFVQKGSAPAVPLTYSANFQTNAAIAAGASGFLAAWTENSGTAYRVCVRRFASDATPIGQPQIANGDDGYPSVQTSSVTSSGDTYLVTWDRTYARRFDGRNARWLDSAPFSLHSIAAASNGTGVLALTGENQCPEYPCMRARPITMSGTATVSAGTVLSNWAVNPRPSIASDGTNYLAVWENGPWESPHLVATRLRPDGSAIDAAPIVLAPYSFDSITSVAWNGNTYLVTWSDQGGISAAYIGSDGTVQQLGRLAEFPGAPVNALTAVAHGGTFVIFSRQEVVSVTLLDGATTTFDRTLSDFLDAASDGTRLMLAYARIDPQAGLVSRVFLEPRIFVTRKRAVH